MFRWLQLLLPFILLPAISGAGECPGGYQPNPGPDVCDCKGVGVAQQCRVDYVCLADPASGFPKCTSKTSSDNPGRPKPVDEEGSSGNSPQAVSGGSAGAATQEPLRCQSPDGRLLPSATLCNDELSTAACGSLFGSGPTDAAPGGEVVCKGDGEPEPFNCNCKAGAKGNACKASNACDERSGACRPPVGRVRSDKCNLPELSDYAAKCAKTCKVCCETVRYGCQDDPAFGIDCGAQKPHCRVPKLQGIMAEACPLTCGLCNSGACRDAMARCASLKHLCRDYSYRTFMATNCARTCGLCAGALGLASGGSSLANARSCVDAEANCAVLASRCDDATTTWKNVMQQSCARTCGLC